MVARTAVTVLWVVAITNAFNLIDGVDGLGCWVCLVFNDGCARSGTHQPVRGGFCNGGALAGAIVGFLRCNFNPATILLGDCGSVFTGFMLSALALQGAQKAPTIMWPFRWSHAACPFWNQPFLSCGVSSVAGRCSLPIVSTFTHKLRQLGLTHRQVVIVLYAVSAVFALLSLLLLWPTGSTLGLVLAVLGAGTGVGVQHLK